ncbi:MAG: ABC transporter ATP-binding protein, partial [Candidatus Riflebacteria bacterium]
MKQPVVISENLCRSFNGRRAVHNVCLNIKPGEIFGIVGPDGAGKSTLLRMLATILPPDSGRALVYGFDTVKEDEMVKGRIAYMSQKFGLYPDLTVEENIKFYADLYCVPAHETEKKINHLLKFSYMHPFRKRLAEKLSGGMKQKLQLICALVHTPEILILDEPTNGVDPVSRRDFWRMLESLSARGVTLIVSTSYLD